MPILYKSQIRRNQPSINASIERGNPLVSDAAFVFTPNCQDVISGITPVTSGSRSFLSTNLNYLSYPAYAYDSFPVNLAQITGPLTIAGIFRVPAGSTTARIIRHVSTSGDGTNNPFSLMWTTSTGGFYTVRAGSSAYGAYGTSSLIAPAGVLNSFAITWNGNSTDTVPTYYNNGSSYVANRLYTAGTATITQSSSNLIVGNPDSQNEIDIALLLIIPRAWNQDDYNSFYLNPWQIFKKKISYFIIPGTGGIGLTVQYTNSSQTLSNIDLTQQNVLAITSNTSSQTLANLDLIQQNILILNNLLSGTTFSILNLVQQNTLVLNSITETSNLGILALVQQNILTIASIIDAQTTNNLSLIQQSNLTIASTLCSQILANIALVSSGTLSINAVAQSTTLQTLALIQQNILSLNSILQSTTLDNLNLSSGSILVLNSINSSESLLNINLVQANILTIQNLLSSSTLGVLILTQANLLSINGMTQAEILGNITLLSGIISAIIEGTLIYVVKENKLVYINEVSKPIYCN